MSRIIQCPNCGQKNKINESSNTSKAICAKCWTKLITPKKTVQAPPPPKEPYTPPQNTKKSEESGSNFGWIWFLLIGAFIWWVIAQDSSSNKPNKVAPSYPEVTMPYNGFTQIYTDNERVAPLTIKTSLGSNYLVKLVSKYSKETVMTIFVVGGNTVSTDVPLGSYEIKYATGDKWFGYKYLFGAETGYSKASKSFVFENTGYQVTGYTISLYRVANGNLRTSKISSSQF